MTYEIILNLRGNILSQLDQAIAKTQTLEQGLNRVGRAGNATGRGGAGGGSLARRVRDSQRLREEEREAERASRRAPVTARRNSFWRAMGFGVNKKGMTEGIRKTREALRILNDDFFRYAFSLNGIRKNFGNFMNVLKNVAGTVGSSVPIVGSLGKGALVGGLASLIPAGVGGLTYLMGTKLLNNQKLTDAVSNTIQMDMAQKGLGPQYSESFRDASRIAAEYGYSRTGVLNTVNTLTGLRNEQGGEISRSQATDLARIIGKLGQVGGAGYNRVAINMQQILASGNNPNLRDIRELVHQAPILSKIAQQQMARVGKAGDTRQWLKDQKNLFDALYEVDKLIGTHPIARIRGQKALHTENLWMDIAKYAQPFFEDIGKGMDKFYSTIRERLRSIMSKYQPGQIDSLINNFVNVFDKLLGAAGGALNMLSKAGAWAADNPVGVGIGLGGAQVALSVGQSVFNAKLIQNAGLAGAMSSALAAAFKTSLVIGGLAALIGGVLKTIKDKNDGEKSLDEKSRETQRRNASIRLANKLIFGPDAQKVNFQDKVNAQGFTERLASVNGGEWVPYDYDRWKAAYEHFKSLPDSLFHEYKGEPGKYVNVVTKNEQMFGFKGSWWNYKEVENRYKPRSYYFEPNDEKALLEGARSLFAPPPPPSPAFESDAEKLETTTRGARALIINFNKEIVSMPTTVYANNVDDLGEKLRPQIEDVVVKGLNLALADSTRMG